MMSRIKDAENAQTVAEMKQRIADLEIQVRTHFIIMFIMCQYIWRSAYIVSVL